MGEINIANGPTERGTKFRRFQDRRGIILTSETKEIGTLRIHRATSLEVKAVILTAVRPSTRASQQSFGIRLEVYNANEPERSEYLDFDESAEFSHAIAFIHEAAKRGADQRDHTDATFSTKDQIEVGCFEGNKRKQVIFIRLGRRDDPRRIPVGMLPRIRNLIEEARSHLIEKGAGTDEAQMQEIANPNSAIIDRLDAVADLLIELKDELDLADEASLAKQALDRLGGIEISARSSNCGPVPHSPRSNKRGGWGHR